MISLDDLRRMEEHLKIEVPDFKVSFKDESLYHKVIAVLLSPFNPGYLTLFTTTVGSTVYFPSKKSYEENPGGSSVTLAHEFVHVCDSKQDWYFKLAYMFPQVLGILPVLMFAVLAWSHAWILGLFTLGYVAGAWLCKLGRRKTGLVTIGATSVLFLVLGVILTKWLVLVLLGLAVIGPWPAHWRVAYELRGYGMTLAMWEWYRAQVPVDYVSQIVQNFTGPSYFYMSWDGDSVQRNLMATRQQAGQGALQTVRPYSVVHSFLYSHGLIHQNGG